MFAPTDEDCVAARMPRVAARIDVERLGGAMAAELGDALCGSWDELQRFVNVQTRRLAASLMEIGEMLASGEVTLEEARTLVEIHKSTTHIVLLSRRGLGSLDVQLALDAAMAVARKPINQALGTTLL